MSVVTPPKTNMTMENHPFLIGDTSSNGCVSIVMLVFQGGSQWGSSGQLRVILL